MIYVSTGGVKNQPAWKTSEDFFDNGIKNIELSGGEHDQDMLAKLKKLKSKVKFQIHNYFPPPKNPFVFNLGSLDKEILSLSVQHAEKAIQWSVELERPIYSFHSGFLLDIAVKELGKKVKKRNLNSHKDVLLNFIENVNKISDYAQKEGVSLLIENNVISKNNLKEFGSNPLFMTNADDCIYVMKNTPKNVNLLIDVAHLKVSSNTEKFDKTIFLKKCDLWIKGFHISENDGTKDSNDIINNNSWFWPYLKNNLDYYSIEVYNTDYKTLYQQQLKVLKKINE